ncbi:hypothetical protein H8356DRAFT_1328555, partial [Neocallimastix lanati (nom. inval.)]
MQPDEMQLSQKKVHKIRNNTNNNYNNKISLLDDFTEFPNLDCNLVEYISIWKHEIMYPNANNFLVNILNDSSCAALSGPQLGQYL